MRVRAALLIVPLLLALLVAPAAASPLDSAGANDGVSAPSAAPALQSDSPNETNVDVVLRINLTADGDARWTVTSRIHGLQTEEDRQSFRDLAREYENGETDAGYSTDDFEPFAAAASESTGREMSIVNGNRSSEIRNGTGYLSLSFTWTNFAQVDGKKLVLGDVFLTPSGTWLSGLDEGQRLVISAPPDYAFESWNFGTSPDGGVESGTATWTGPVTFAPGDIQATYVATDGPSDRGPLSPDSSLGTLAMVGGGLVAVLGGLALGGYVLRDRRDAVSAYVAALPVVGDDERAMPAADEADDSPAGRLTSPDDAADRDGPDAVEEAADDESAAEGGADDATAAGETQDQPAEEDDEGIDPELLSDEERVERLLRRNGGRMKQANVVKETGWSNAKVSQLLSSMDEDDRVDKLRIGRENLISLPDEDVADVE